jgi:hypothetical protein
MSLNKIVIVCSPVRSGFNSKVFFDRFFQHPFNADCCQFNAGLFGIGQIFLGLSGQIFQPDAHEKVTLGDTIKLSVLSNPRLLGAPKTSRIMGWEIVFFSYLVHPLHAASCIVQCPRGFGLS